jgi:hypothetical protein
MFVIASQTAAASKPAKGAFHHPAPRENLKALCMGWTTHYFQFPSAVLFDPNDDIFISAICPNQFETTPAIVQAVFDELEPFRQNQFASIYHLSHKLPNFSNQIAGYIADFQSR